MLTRLDRYLLREAAVTFTAVTGVLLVILLSNQLARILGQAAQAELSGRIVLALVGLTTLQQLTILLPVGLFLGIVLALGRLYHESEMTAVGACGIGPLSIYRPVVLLAVMVAWFWPCCPSASCPAGARAQQIRIERCGWPSSGRSSPAVSAASQVEMRSSTRSGRSGREAVRRVCPAARRGPDRAGRG